MRKSFVWLSAGRVASYEALLSRDFRYSRGDRPVHNLNVCWYARWLGVLFNYSVLLNDDTPLEEADCIRELSL